MSQLIRTKDANALKLSDYNKSPRDEYWKYYMRIGYTVKSGVTGLNGCIMGKWGNGTRYENFALPNCVGYAHGRAYEMWDTAKSSLDPSKQAAVDSYINKLKQLTCNAENFLYKAYSLGMNVSTPYQMNSMTYSMDNYKKSNGNLIKNTSCVPKVGSICVFGKGSLNSSPPAGHVTVCEVADGTSGIFSESGWQYAWNNIFTSKEYDPLCYANGSSGYKNGNYSQDKSNRLNKSGYYFLGYIYPPDEVSFVLQNASVMGGDNEVYKIQNSLWVP